MEKNTKTTIFEAVFRSSIDGILTIDHRGLIIMMNAAAANLFGYLPEDVSGKNISMLMPEPDHSRHDSYLANYQQTGRRKIIGIGREVTGLRSDGTTFPFRLSVGEATHEGKKLYTGIIHDLTKEKAGEKKLAEINEKLEAGIQQRTKKLTELVAQLKQKEIQLIQSLEKEKELNELKSRFVSMASHEFRTPLSAIISSASLIERYPNTEDNDKRLKHVLRIKSSARNLTSILEEFLSIEKLESGKVTLSPSKFDCTTLAANLISELKGLLKKDQLINYAHTGSVKDIYLDEKIVLNIGLNLLSNAIKYSTPNSTIELMTKTENDHFVLSVEDHGIGIPKKEQHLLFTRFFRAKNVTNVEGTGLGLTIVNRYIKLLNGTIQFTSEENKGSVFTISIPLTEPPITL